MALQTGLMIGFAIAFVAYIYWKLCDIYKYFEKRGTPYVKPTFFLGSNPKGAFLREHISKSWADMYKALKPNKVGGFFQYLSPVYIVIDPDYVQKVLISDFSHFVDRNIKVDEEVNPLDGNLFFLQGQKWRYLRNKLIPMFTSGKLKWMFDLMRKCGDELTERFDTLADGKNHDFKEDLSKFTIDVIGNCAFGFDSDAQKNPNSDFYMMGKKILGPNFIETFKFILRLSFPELFVKLKIKSGDAEVNKFFSSIIKQGFDHRLKTNTQRSDVVQLLLQLKEKGFVDIEPEETAELLNEGLDIKNSKFSSSCKLNFTDELLAAQSFLFFIAGYETTASTMYFTLYYLSKYPEIQDKVREEVRRIKKKLGVINYEAVKEMAYLEKCICESLRLYPPLSHLFRECTKDYTFPDGTKIEKGVMVVLPLFGLQRDPEHFPDPEVYRPERFDSPPRPGTYAPFGEGPRICIGKRFAFVEMKLTISTIIDKFYLEESEITKPIELNPKAFVTSVKDGLFIRLRKINE